jgi:FkbM family methyltransferase
MSNLRKRLTTKLLLPRHIQHHVPCEDHGSDYGGWTISPPVQGIVYSFGVGEDISFEKSLAASYDVKIFAFDPTPRSITWMQAQSVSSDIHFLDYGVADYDGIAQFYLPEDPNFVSHSIIRNGRSGAIEVPVKRLPTIMSELGHTYIEVMKFDIEAAEYAVLQDLIRSGIRPRQLLVEFHHRFSEAGAAQTWRVVRQLNRYGYHIFYISPSIEEFSFIRA